MPYQKEIKGIKFLQDRSKQISDSHHEIASDLDIIKAQLLALGSDEVAISPEFQGCKDKHLAEMTASTPLIHVPLKDIYAESSERYTQPLGLADILSISDFEAAEQKYGLHVQDFNKRYSLDGWDYAIAGACGLLAAMLDIFCVSAPLKPTASYNTKVNGIFNQWVQKAFNTCIPPDLSNTLSKNFNIGAPDCSTIFQLIGAPDKALNPMNHRLLALSHDPILSFIFGVWDMMHGTCTIVNKGKIVSVPSTKGTTDGNIFQLLGRMMGHLFSDVNAPSAHGNRGMGLPAPFMGLLRMFEGMACPPYTDPCIMRVFRP